jgi:hypothetical protein
MGNVTVGLTTSLRLFARVVERARQEQRGLPPLPDVIPARSWPAAWS